MGLRGYVKRLAFCNTYCRVRNKMKCESEVYPRSRLFSYVFYAMAYLSSETFRYGLCISKLFGPIIYIFVLCLLWTVLFNTFYLYTLFRT